MSERFYPNNVHQPWPLALKFCRRAGHADTSPPRSLRVYQVSIASSLTPLGLGLAPKYLCPPQTFLHFRPPQLLAISVFFDADFTARRFMQRPSFFVKTVTSVTFSSNLPKKEIFHKCTHAPPRHPHGPPKAPSTPAPPPPKV